MDEMNMGIDIKALALIGIVVVAVLALVLGFALRK